MWPRIFGNQNKNEATGYRFGDFTFDELVYIKVAFKSYLEYLNNKMKTESRKCDIQMLAEEGQIISRLYDEVSAAIKKYRDDQHRLGSWMK